MLCKSLCERAGQTVVQHQKAQCSTFAAVHDQETCQDTGKAGADQGDKPHQLASALRFDLEGIVVGLRPPDEDHDQPNAQASMRDMLRHARGLRILLRNTFLAWSEGVLHGPYLKEVPSSV